MSEPEPELSLFPDLAPAEREPEPELNTGERRRRRQAEAIARGQHPLSVALRINLPLHPLARRDVGDPRDGTPRCGTCAYREVVSFGPNADPKCRAKSYDTTRAPYSWERPHPSRLVNGRIPVTVHPRQTNGPGTTVKRGWPACTDYYRP
jgi:hypothetical protein